MNHRVGLRLDPLDTLFFRDGRPFAPATRGEGGLPLPRTLAGALRSHLVRQYVPDMSELGRLRRDGMGIVPALSKLGCPSWVLNARFRGPWLARCEKDVVEPLVPAPVILSRDDKTLFRLRPLSPKSLPGWQDPDGLHPLWRAGGADAKPVGGYLTQAGLKRFLEGDVPTEADLIKAEDLFGFDDRTGLEIEPDCLTGKDGMLYGIRLLALKKNVCLYAEVEPGEQAPNDWKRYLEGALPFGGEGRHVRSTTLEPWKWPEVTGGDKSLWLLTTPAPLKAAHRPDVLPEGVKVISAATASPIAFSGWDVARNGPEPTRFAVPAGGVYFVEGELRPEHGSFCTGEDAVVGWGLVLRGRWNDA